MSLEEIELFKTKGEKLIVFFILQKSVFSIYKSFHVMSES